jgi:hypothetical protein
MYAVKRNGPELALLRPICWVRGHREYTASGKGWSMTKFQCRTCGKHTGAKASLSELRGKFL